MDWSSEANYSCLYFLFLFFIYHSFKKFYSSLSVYTLELRYLQDMT